MGASTDLAMDTETRQRIDDLRRDVQRDRDRFNAKALGLRFLCQPDSHPHRGMVWVDDPGYSGGPVGWTPHWTRYGGVWLCPIYVPNEDRTDVVSYEVFFDGIKEEACRKFRQHACEVAALLQRLGCALSVSICRESELVRTLFERNRTELHWEENEEPGHPETKSHIARLKDIYGHTESFLIDLLDEFAPPSLAQHLQVAQEIEVDRQGSEADDESGLTTMASVGLLPSSESSPPAPEPERQGGKADDEDYQHTKKMNAAKNLVDKPAEPVPPNEAIQDKGYVTATRLADYAGCQGRQIRDVLTNCAFTLDSSGRKLWRYCDALPFLRKWCKESTHKKFTAVTWPDIADF